jgi:hypothetical protein
MSESWAFCTNCRRWFHCPEWFDHEQPPPRCPVCTLGTTAIESRASSAAARPGRRPRGRCQFCAEWFDCTTWDDPGAPMPRCPACGAPPPSSSSRAIAAPAPYPARSPGTGEHAPEPR